MTEERTRMKIGIDGKVYTLDTAIQKSLTQIPWKSRKKVIAVLEAMKQAEHVEKPQATEAVKLPQQPINPQKQASPNQVMATQSKADYSAPVNNVPPDVNPKDPDAIMQQLLMQQPKVQAVPDKSTAIKWIAVFFAVVISLVLLFG